MKKILLLFIALTFVIAFASCVDGEGQIQCEHSYVEIERIEPRPMVDGEAKYECLYCEEIKIEIIPKTKSLKVLAIGNSFSIDAVTYLYDICKSEAMTEIVIGNVYISGSSLDMHKDNISSDNAAYAYKKYSTVKGSYEQGVTLEHALLDEDWDFITLQQASQLSGQSESFSNLETIIGYVNQKCPESEIYWHMTWAYQQDSTHAGFGNYDNDQMTMYNAIVDTVQSTVLTNPAFKGVIPSGTAMQNLRASYWGDNATRDGYHASYGIGRFTIGLTWYAFFTGGSLDDVYWVPTGDYNSEIIWNWDLMVESASNAIENPYQITESQYTEFPVGYPEK